MTYNMNSYTYRIHKTITIHVFSLLQQYTVITYHQMMACHPVTGANTEQSTS